jgi:uncharacterized membrane protein AbrB (regulator of aidB expression)
MLKKFVILVILISLVLALIGIVQQLIFHRSNWLYLTIYATLLGIIPGALALMVLTIGKKD